MTIVHELHVIYNPFSCIIPPEDVPHTLNRSSHALIADRSAEGARSVAQAMSISPMSYDLLGWEKTCVTVIPYCA